MNHHPPHPTPSVISLKRWRTGLGLIALELRWWAPPHFKFLDRVVEVMDMPPPLINLILNCKGLDPVVVS